MSALFRALTIRRGLPSSTVRMLLRGIRFDPTSPITDVSAELFALNVGFGRVFPAFVGRIVGTSLTIAAPTGQTFPTSSSTSAPTAGLQARVRRLAPAWRLDFRAGRRGLAVFAEHFFGGQRKEQRALGSVQAHAGYTLRPRMWLAADFTFYSGGRTEIDDVMSQEFQESTRIGLTFALPVTRATSLKLAWSTGTSTRMGGDFDTYVVAWQTTFFGRPARPVPATQR